MAPRRARSHIIGAMTDDDKVFLALLKRRRADSERFVALIMADPTGYDALGVIRNTKELIEDTSRLIAKMESRDI